MQKTGSTTYTTARTLLSILRLSQALARLRFQEDVIQEDVDEAVRLMEASSRSLAERQRNTGTREDPVDAIYQIIVNFMTQRRLEEVKISEVEPQIRAKGFTEEQLKACIAEYEDINVWQSHAGTHALVGTRTTSAAAAAAALGVCRPPLRG